YLRGGVGVLTNTVRAEQAVAPERLYVRVVGRGVDAVVLSNPEGWNPQRLEVESARLADGTILQVGKSTEAREEILSRLRTALTMVTVLIIAVAFVGGWFATRSAMYPIRQLTQTVRGIIETGRTDSRVPVTGPKGGDAIDELSVLFN